MNLFRKIIVTLPVLFFANFSFAKPITLALNWKAEPQFGGFYAALSEFEKAGLTVKVQEGGSGTPTIQMLAAGQVDYAIVSADELIVAKTRGAGDLIALFATYQTNPQGLLTHEARNFKSLAEVLQSNGTLLWQAGLPYAQFLAKKYAPLKVKTAPYQGGLGAFQADPQISQQCFVTSEPLLAQKMGLKTKTFLISDSGFNPYTTVLVTQAKTLKQNKPEVLKIVNAIRKGWAEYLTDPTATNQTMSKINKAMDLETFKVSAQAQKDLIAPKDLKVLGSMTRERWETLVQQMLDLKVISTPVLADSLFINL